MNIDEKMDRLVADTGRYPYFDRVTAFYLTTGMWTDIQKSPLFLHRGNVCLPVADMAVACCVGYYCGTPVRIVTKYPHMLVRRDGRIIAIGENDYD